MRLKFYYPILILCAGCAVNNTDNQANQSQKKSIRYIYSESQQFLRHSMNPWDAATQTTQGEFSFNDQSFLKRDHVKDNKGDTTSSSILLNQNVQLFRSSYWREGKPDRVNQDDFYQELLNTARYTPYFIEEFARPKAQHISDREMQLKTDKFHITIYYSPSQHIDSIITVSALTADDEYYGFGDRVTRHIYTDYNRLSQKEIPTTVVSTQFNRRLTNMVTIHSAKRGRPISFPEKSDSLPLPVSPDISVERFNDQIYFINLHHCGTRSIVVNFGNYLFVGESPLNSENGELLIQEVRRLFPSTPIKFFAFGHFHPHYTGGIRPFMHKKATIISRASDLNYLDFIHQTNYTLKPDSLSLEPQPLRTKIIKDSLHLKGPNEEMIIYHIGTQSNHTNDYLIYYFPSEKMIFEDDLVWIGKNSTRENLHPMTVGFYKAVKALNIPVETVVQNWPVFNKERKMHFKFADIEQIMNTD